LDKMFMCGNLGDPAAAKDTIGIFRYFREINPKIILGMNTNGGLRNVRWWEELATVLNQPKDYVVFSIDGLADTNHIYRINVNWQQVIKNTKAFIKAGGSAHWDMLVFRHNEHQVDAAQQMSKDMKFKWFRAKVSKRHQTYPINFLNLPTNWKDPVVTQGEITCQALKEQSVYVDARGRWYPCCWLGQSRFTLDQFDSIKSNWLTKDRNPICVQTCSSKGQGTSFTNQWQREIQL